MLLALGGRVKHDYSSSKSKSAEDATGGSALTREADDPRCAHQNLLRARRTQATAARRPVSEATMESVCLRKGQGW